MILSARLWICSWGQIIRVWMSSCLALRFTPVALNWLVSVVQVWESCCNLARAVTRVSREQLILIPGYSEKASPPPLPPSARKPTKANFPGLPSGSFLALAPITHFKLYRKGRKWENSKGRWFCFGTIMMQDSYQSKVVVEKERRKPQVQVSRNRHFH